MRAYRLLLSQIGAHGGRAFNLGGGPENAVTLRDVISEIERLTNKTAQLQFVAARTGDQVFYVSNTRALSDTVGWSPKIGRTEGVGDLVEWLSAKNNIAREPLVREMMA